MCLVWVGRGRASGLKISAPVTFIECTFLHSSSFTIVPFLLLLTEKVDGIKQDVWRGKVGRGSVWTGRVKGNWLTHSPGRMVVKLACVCFYIFGFMFFFHKN